MEIHKILMWLRGQYKLKLSHFNYELQTLLRRSAQRSFLFDNLAYDFSSSFYDYSCDLHIRINTHRDCLLDNPNENKYKIFLELVFSISHFINVFWPNLIEKCRETPIISNVTFTDSIDRKLSDNLKWNLQNIEEWLRMKWKERNAGRFPHEKSKIQAHLSLWKSGENTLFQKHENHRHFNRESLQMQSF